MSYRKATVPCGLALAMKEYRMYFQLYVHILQNFNEPGQNDSPAVPADGMAIAYNVGYQDRSVVGKGKGVKGKGECRRQKQGSGSAT